MITDTALYADVVLPATTFLEHYDFVKAYGPITLQLARPVIEQVGESRPNAEVFAELIRRVGLERDGDPAGELEAMLQMLDGLPEPHGDELRAQCDGDAPFDGRPVQFVDVLPRTRIRRSTCFPRISIARRRSDCMDFSQTRRPTVSPGADLAGQRANGQLDARRAAAARRAAGHAPEDAAARDIEDGEIVRMFNDQGEVRIAGARDAARAARAPSRCPKACGGATSPTASRRTRSCRIR